MLIPVTRIVAVAMSGVLCFGILLPLALRRHNVWLAVFVSVVFAAYLIANIVLYLRMRKRA